jgi:glycosyltransferase involved in cell wall biosynthesis
MKKIKVLHIIGGDSSGGAAKGALIVHRELMKLGVDSWILKQVGKDEPDKRIHSLSSGVVNKIRRMLYTFLDRLPLFFYRGRRKDVAFSFGCFGFDITKLKHYKEADVVNLHWINQGTLSLRCIRRIKKPIVWTIRDMWLMTGGCHHSFDCEKYVKTCGKCPILGSTASEDLSSVIFRFKKEMLPSKISYVTISNWLKECALKSTLLKDSEIEVIHNGVSLDDFEVIEKTRARKELGLPLYSKIVLLGATNLHDPYKGFAYFLECLPVLLLDVDVFFVFFGHFKASDYSTLLKDRFVSFGPIQDSAVLNRIYSAADVFVAPSVAEAFGKTLVESMLSGTPVVCFDSTAPAEIVQHKVTGYKATHKSSIELGAGIQWCLEDEARLARLSRDSRFYAEARFSGRVCALRYKALYEKVVGDSFRQTT